MVGAMATSDEKFFIQDQSRSLGNSALWWRPNLSGYTINLDEAGRYTLEEALKIERMRGTDVKVLESIARRAAMTTVDVGWLREEIEKARKR
jgi:hypothetical protein